MSDHKVEFVDVAAMAQWIQKDGVGNIIAGMVDFLEEDFKKWQSFDKIPRVASHTPFGVIELMPTSDNVTYSFKYVNGHPSKPARGYQTATAFTLHKARWQREEPQFGSGTQLCNLGAGCLMMVLAWVEWQNGLGSLARIFNMEYGWAWAWFAFAALVLLGARGSRWREGVQAASLAMWLFAVMSIGRYADIWATEVPLAGSLLMLGFSVLAALSALWQPETRHPDGGKLIGFAPAVHAVLLPAHGQGGDVVEAAGIVDRLPQRPPPTIGVDLGAIGMRRLGLADEGAGDGVADDDLAGLRRGVDAGDECHAASFHCEGCKGCKGCETLRKQRGR